MQGLVDKVQYVKESAEKGKDEIVPDFPVDVLAPFVSLFYVVQFTDKITFEENFAKFTFSLTAFDMLTDKQRALLKPITGDYYDTVSEENGEAMFQLQLDDNLFNSLFAVLVSVEKTFSYRELTKGNPKLAQIEPMLTTSTLGTVLPQFVEDYGANKKIDVSFTPSHELFKDGFPGSKMSGVYMDKNGNWKAQINIAASINVDMDRGSWRPVRDLYITITFKLKTTTEIDEVSGEKSVVLLPKNIEISQLKVLKDNEEEQME